MTTTAFLGAIQGSAQVGEAAAEHTGLVVTLVGAFVVLMVIAAAVAALSKRLKLPFTVGLVIAGATLAWLADRWTLLAPIGELEVTPEAVFFLFLPTLIFQSAYHLDARALKANLAPTLLLAVPGLLASTAMIAAIMRVAGPSVGLDLTWPEALLLGSILSATDPVAVVSLFSQLGAPKRLTVLVEGESLFNEATAIVLSRIILGVMAVGTFNSGTVLSGALTFGAVFFGGLLVGTVLALVAGLIIGRVHNDAFIEITVTTVLAYLSFYLAEHTFHLSGVMAVVGAGVLIGGWGKTKVSPSVADYLEHFWDYVAGVANAMIFLLVGLTVNLAALVDALPILVWVIFAMLVSRALVIFTLMPMVGRLPGVEPVSRSYQAVMYWGGLRGGIALAIALALPDSVAHKEMFITIAIGAVLFTLLVQGLTIEKVVKHYGLHIPPLSDRLARLEGLIAGKLRTLQELPLLEAGGLFPHRIAGTVQANTDKALEELRSELSDLRERELDVHQEKRILYLRSFAEEKTLYFEMFSKGHLTEGAYRDLVHSIELQSEAVRHDGRLPDFTLHPPTGERIGATLFRIMEKGPGLGGLVERLREGRAERDYEVAWARFHGDARVIESFEQMSETGAHREESLEEVLTYYKFWRENARGRLDQTAELFPEFVAATQDRLAGRLALQAEKEALEQRARSGAIPRGVANQILEDLSQRMVDLSTTRTGKLAVDPEELLKNVPFFEGLPREEFGRVAQRLKRRTAPGGDPIVKQGERGSSLFLVARGVVRVIRRDDDVERNIATLIAGDFFGEMALLHGGVRTATCRAVTPCALYELARADLDSVMESCPGMREALDEADRVRRIELREGGAKLDDEPSDA
ncbi:MAG: cation:proton antiporter [Gemmatimonadetes bacterium]|nr:cation:proton antiporter [Gemmatimonadota bacterium]